MRGIRIALSLDGVWAQSLCLLARLYYLREGAHAAAERRHQAAREEEGRRRDQIAHYLAHIRGRGVNRAGEVFTIQDLGVFCWMCLGGENCHLL